MKKNFYVHTYGPSASVHEKNSFLPNIISILESSLDPSFVISASIQDIRIIPPLSPVK